MKSVWLKISMQRRSGEASNDDTHVSDEASNGDTHVSDVASNGDTHVSGEASNGDTHVSYVASGSITHVTHGVLVVDCHMCRAVTLVATSWISTGPSGYFSQKMLFQAGSALR